MPAGREEFIFTTDGTLTIWNRDTGSLRDMGQFVASGSASPLVLLDIDVSRDGTVYGVDGDSLYRLDLRTNTATFEAFVGAAANALEITEAGNFLVGYGLSEDISVFRGGDFSLLRTLSTSAPGSSDVFSAGDLQLIGNTVFLTSSNDELVGLNVSTGAQVARLSDPLFASAFGLSSQGDNLLIYAGTSVYRLSDGMLDEIAELDLEFSVFGAADAAFPRTVFNATSGADLLQGGFFSERIFAFAGRDTVFAGRGDDLVAAGDGADRVNGGFGYDEIYGGLGADTLKGGEGNDTVYGGIGADFIWGEGGNDLLGGAAGNDTMLGGFGRDVLGGAAGDDLAIGGRGQDVVFGAAGEDLIFGSGGADTLYGGDDADTISGGGGDDALFGGSGADRLNGALGDDVLTGGVGPDSFVFVNRFGADRITDFRANDVIDLTRVFQSATNFAELIDLYGSQVGSDARIFFANDRQIVLEDIALEDLSADQFIL